VVLGATAHWRDKSEISAVHDKFCRFPARLTLMYSDVCWCITKQKKVVSLSLRAGCGRLEDRVRFAPSDMEASQSKIGADGRMTLIQSLAREEIRREWEVETAQSKRSFEALRLHLPPDLFVQSQRKLKPSKLVPKPKPPCEYLTTAQAAALAGKTAATIRRWANQKLIPLADLPDRDGKPPRIYSIPTENFKRWLRDHHTNVPPD
jgi:hypothetical protein